MNDIESILILGAFLTEKYVPVNMPTIIIANIVPVDICCDPLNNPTIKGYKNEINNIDIKDKIANFNGSFNSHVVKVVCFIVFSPYLYSVILS